MNGIGAEALSAGGDPHAVSPRERHWTTPGGIPIHFHLGPPPSGPAVTDLAPLATPLGAQSAAACCVGSTNSCAWRG